MTTFQDPPPQSRRAVRQSERGETPPADAQNPFLPEGSTPSAPVAPAAQPAPQTGRRARPAAAPDPAAGEPLTYTTQNRLAPPVGDQFVAEPLAAQPPPQPFQGQPAPQAPQGVPPQGEYRVRDFSPEGSRRSAINRELQAPTFAAPVDLDYQTQGAIQAGSNVAQPEQPLEDTVNHTLSRRELREMRAAEEQAAPALKLPEPIDTLLNSGPIDIPTLAPPPGQSQALAEAMAEFDLLTRARREAEAQARDAQVASLQTPIQHAAVQVPSVQVPPEQVPSVQVPPEQVPSVQVPPEQAPSALVPSVQIPSVQVPSVQVPSVQQPPALIEPQVASAPFPTYPAPTSVPQPPVQQASAPSAPVAPPYVASAPVAPVASAPAPFAEAPVEQAFFDVAGSAPIAPAASVPVPQQQFPQQHVPSAPTPVGSADAVFMEPAPRTSRSSGHWSAQVDADDEELPFENTLSRTVGSNTSAITTSALVLPSVPQPDSILRNIGTTGEILITGSIDLPRSLASTGAHPGRVDNSDFEDDPLDSQVSAPDSAPVRAIRAVSTHTSKRGVIENKVPQNSNRLLTAGIVSASVLGLGVVGFLIFAFATHTL